MTENRTRVGLIGASGYWAARLLPNLYNLSEFEVAAASSRKTPLKKLVERLQPETRATRNFSDILADPRIEAVIIATPGATHFEIAREALQAGKHVLAEKPLTLDSREAARLVNLADRNNRILMVDHTYLFSKHITEFKKLLDSGLIGRPIFHHSGRANLGIIRTDCNVVWDLGYHDLYLIRHLYPEGNIRQVSASGSAHLVPGIEDVCDFGLEFEDGLYASSHLSWLTPVKVRRVVISGERGALEYRDDRQIFIHDKAIETKRGHLSVRDQGEREQALPAENNPLGQMLQHFHECVRERRKSPIASAEHSLEVVRLAEAVCRAMKSGRRVRIS